MAMTRTVSAFLLAGVMSLSMAAMSFGEEAHAPAAGHGGAAAHAEEENPSILPTPQKGIAPAVTTLIVFSLLVAILAKYAWAPIASGLKAREDKIRKDIDDAEAARARAESTLKEYEARLATAEQQVRDMLAKATTQGEQIADTIRTRAQQEAEESKNKALRDIDASRKQAVAEIYDQAATLATEVAKRVLPRSLSEQDQQALLERSVEQVQSLRQSPAAAAVHV